MTISNLRSADRSTGYVAEDELVLLADDGVDAGVAGTTTVPCGVAGTIIAASAALPGFCPTGACTSKC
ncbi:class II lanthipeptide, LchA2/BrtA2 family [Curtobacterium sp. MCLR17_036]|uniref:class II lanthipeptide, LchA2/BrtA2 family n=1 Tax=Curtobacterium sp. MCLR17_036 TaxID=2175620 RepID=UPI000DA81D5C|nr:class II lanthipeptide, LchA2/BrtA2 family [Curtobacterium sp. MCLR17_036]WIE65092.1 class II lanthipeptide, LchA2/BrtA2 family [Curtobacterium sp. MCLR17_036]